MKLEPLIILKLLSNFSDCDPQYSYKLYSYKKSVLSMLEKSFIRQAERLSKVEVGKTTAIHSMIA